MKRRREYHGCGEEYNVKKGKGEAISSSLVLMAVGKNIKCERGKGDGNFGEENQAGANIKL